MSLAAACLAALAVGLLFPAAPLGLQVDDRPRAPSSRAPVVVATSAGVALLGVWLWDWLDLRRVVLVVLAALLVAGVVRLLRRRRATTRAEQRADQVLALCDALASDLAAGQPPLASLDRAAAEWPELAPVAVAGQMGADVPAQLRELSRRPGAGQLRTVAATWQVAHETGAGLAAAIGQAAGTIRAERRTARLVATELAAAHATARMLAVLPVGVLLLGAGIGGDPVGFLTGTTPGLACLASGMALSFAGLRWLDRIADRVLPR